MSINVSFLAGPHKPVYGFHAVHASDFQTTIYLQNAAGAPAPTSATTITPPADHRGQLTAHVDSDGQPGSRRRHVTFTVTYGGSPLSVCTAPVDVNTTTGTADLHVHPRGGRHLRRDRLLLRHK